MPLYCVNKNAQIESGDHEVHVEGCLWWPNDENRINLGNHIDCHFAVAKAKEYYPTTANGCKYCSIECHTT